MKLFGIACVTALFASGYAIGHGKAEAEGQANINALKVECEEERRRNSEAYGKALAETLEQYEREVARADIVSAQYAESKKVHTKETESLQRRIRHAVRGNSHTFSPDFVKLYNEAIGLSGDALSQALYTRSAHGTAGTGGTSGAGWLDPFTGVTERDLLEHIAGYGRRCRGLEAQVLGWQALERGR